MNITFTRISHFLRKHSLIPTKVIFVNFKQHFNPQFDFPKSSEYSYKTKLPTYFQESRFVLELLNSLRMTDKNNFFPISLSFFH